MTPPISQEFIQEVISYCKMHGIILKPIDIKVALTVMPDSVTNQIIRAQDIFDREYFIRINGRLRSPFTRHDESLNLKRLASAKIQTHVVLNAKRFQLCDALHAGNRFSAIPHTQDRTAPIQKVGRGIKKFHNLGGFNNEYPVGNTICHDFQRLSKEMQENLYRTYLMVLSIWKTLHEDRENYISSHNDLLPSSIYLDEEHATFIDWEYSGNNHRAYDLALFILKAQLNTAEEEQCVLAYDKINPEKTMRSVRIMKPVVNFLLVLWSAGSKQSNDMAKNLLSLHFNVQYVVYVQSAARLLSQVTLSNQFFKKSSTMPLQLAEAPVNHPATSETRQTVSL